MTHSNGQPVKAHDLALSTGTGFAYSIRKYTVSPCHFEVTLAERWELVFYKSSDFQSHIIGCVLKRKYIHTKKRFCVTIQGDSDTAICVNSNIREGVSRLVVL